MAAAPDSTCVLIVGMHRSGTSLVAGALNILGLSLGDPANMMPPNEGNPTGYWEHLRLVDVNDRILDSMARAWPTSVPLPPDWIVTPVGERATASLRQALSAEIGAEPRWGFKAPRATLLIPAYRKALDQLHIRPKVLLGLRNPLDVARSLQRRDDIPLEKGIAMWANYTLSALADSVGLDM